MSLPLADSASLQREHMGVMWSVDSRTHVARTAEADGGAPANAALKRSSSHRRLVMEEATAASEAMSTVVWAWAWNETAGVPTSRCSSEDGALGPSEE